MALMHEGHDPQSAGTLQDDRKDADRMRRIDERTVELTDEEELFEELFNIQLDQGHGMAAAVMKLSGHDLPEGLRSKTPRLDAILTPEFVSWLIN